MNFIVDSHHSDPHVSGISCLAVSSSAPHCGVYSSPQNQIKLADFSVSPAKNLNISTAKPQDSAKICAMVSHPSGLVFAADEAGSLKIFRPGGKNEPIFSSKIHGKRVNFLSFSSDFCGLVSCSNDKIVKFFAMKGTTVDKAIPSFEFSFSKHGSFVIQAELTPDGTALLSLESRQLILSEPRKNREISAFSAPGAPLLGFKVPRGDEKFAWVFDESGVFYLADLVESRVVKSLSLTSFVPGAFAASRGSGRLVMLESKTRSPVSRTKSAKLAPQDSQRVLVIDLDGSEATGGPFAIFELSASVEIQSCAIADDGTRVFLAGNSTIFQWRDSEVKRRTTVEAPVSSARVSRTKTLTKTLPPPSSTQMTGKPNPLCSTTDNRGLLESISRFSASLVDIERVLDRLDDRLTTSETETQVLIKAMEARLAAKGQALNPSTLKPLNASTLQKDPTSPSSLQEKPESSLSPEKKATEPPIPEPVNVPEPPKPVPAPPTLPNPSSISVNISELTRFLEQREQKDSFSFKNTLQSRKLNASEDNIFNNVLGNSIHTTNRLDFIVTAHEPTERPETILEGEDFRYSLATGQPPEESLA